MQVASPFLHNIGHGFDRIECGFCSAAASVSCENCGVFACHNDIIEIDVEGNGVPSQLCYECTLTECGVCQMCNGNYLAVTGCFSCERRLCNGCRHSCSSDDCAHIDYCSLCWPDCLQQCTVCEQVRCNFDELALCLNCGLPVCDSCERGCNSLYCESIFCEPCSHSQLQLHGGLLLCEVCVSSRFPLYSDERLPPEPALTTSAEASSL